MGDEPAPVGGCACWVRALPASTQPGEVQRAMALGTVLRCVKKATRQCEGRPLARDSDLGKIARSWISRLTQNGRQRHDRMSEGGRNLSHQGWVADP